MEMTGTPGSVLVPPDRVWGLYGVRLLSMDVRVSRDSKRNGEDKSCLRGKPIQASRWVE